MTYFVQKHTLLDFRVPQIIENYNLGNRRWKEPQVPILLEVGVGPIHGLDVALAGIVKLLA